MKVVAITCFIAIIIGIYLMVYFVSLPVETDYWVRRGGFALGFFMVIIGGGLLWSATKKKQN